MKERKGKESNLANVKENQLTVNCFKRLLAVAECEGGTRRGVR